MLYGLAVFPSSEIQEFADRYRKRYDTHYSIIKPHLTLREKELISEEQLEKGISYLTEAARKLEPFILHFNRFSTFYPANNVIYMALADPEPMQKAYEVLCSGVLQEQAKPYAFTPHLTIAQELGDDELHDVLSSVRKQPVDFRCTVNHVVLLRQTENGIWQSVQEFPLGGSGE
ncbi:2'-5' RNA ligase family protein [Paenibacillus sp. GD4]|uniref:2'-5' RNA ligase family protein n=1 Tax=Paenibacillus sp. GD4 TaxID=3068890 RepID=UPI00279646EB|nr:2'-5' RNA ligase family protein [Paenibacillus sp. GD4]MDQ1913052.1 2'-5' RNA ligase family protein [Paenibacillus sp. GD4]